MKLDLKKLECKKNNINLDEYINFREYVKSNMQFPEWLGDFTKEDLENMLKDNSKIWMYYLDNEPVCSMMFIPSTKQALDKFEVDLDYKIVADYGPMMVSPKYIGNNLQLQMLKELDEYSIENNYEYVASTIHPDNGYSINNFLKHDFKLLNQKELKRGLRNIYLKRLKNSNMIVENDLSYEEYIEIINTVGWKQPSKRQLEKSLKNSMTVKYVIDNETVGMARLITDSGYVALLTDVVVKPNYQGQKIGTKMINNLLERIKIMLEDDEQMLIQLLAASNKTKFYEKFGFKDKKTVVEAGMYTWLKK